MWMKEMFGTDKPVIGMLHLMALPTDPKYDREGGVKKVLERARRDLHALQDGGIDGVLFCNEFSIPYTSNVRPVTIACMARIIGELKSEITVPFGVDVAMDPYKVFDLAVAVDADFVRETFMGAYAGVVYGVTNYPVGDIERHRVEVGAGNIRTLATLVPEGAESLAPDYAIPDVAKSAEFNVGPDALLIYGLTAGASIDNALIPQVKAKVSTPVFASNGVNINTVEDTLRIADGCVVGTWLKVDGKFFNPTDTERVKALMDKAKAFRGE